MKVGTLTYHRADNYGAVLQAYALCQYLSEQKVDAGIIDYWPKHHAEVYKLWCWNKSYFHYQGMKGKIKYLLYFPIVIIKNYKRKHNFEIFRRNSMKTRTPYVQYDAVFYGSDTIWNKWNLNNLYSGFDPTYWGAGTISARYRFSYAPSMGNVFNDENTRNHCKKYLSRFDRISVREILLKNRLEDWGYRDIQITVDPTMLLSRHHWDSLITKRIVKDEYILCYNLEHSNICKEMAKKLGIECNMRVIELTGQVSGVCSKDLFDTAGPFEFLSLFSYATYVVTSSFHGCVFSIIFNKQFCFHSEVETERILNLLQAYGLSERFVNSSDTQYMYNKINYKVVNNITERKVAVSKKFIADCLQTVS